MHGDSRGTIAFVNEFDMTKVKRFYRIDPINIETIRAWQGHQKETKWLHCARGRFLIKLIKVDDWENPSKDLEIDTGILKANASTVLHVPPGYVTGIKALDKDASLIIFSDCSLEDSKEDDFRYDKDYWTTNWKT